MQMLTMWQMRKRKVMSLRTRGRKGMGGCTLVGCQWGTASPFV